MTTTRERLRAGGVLALGAFLVVQAVLSFGFNPQPYPAVRMPRFGQAASVSGRLPASRLDVTVRFRDGAVRRVVPADLAGDVRYSQVQAMLTRAFRGKADADLDPDLRRWLSERVAAIDPRPAAQVSFCWRSASIDVAHARAAHTSPCDLTTVRVTR